MPGALSRRAAVLAAVGVTTVTALAGTAVAQPAAPGGTRVVTDPSGQVRQLLPQPGRAALDASTPSGRSVVAQAFGVPASQLVEVASYPIGTGRTVRLQQQIAGIPVQGAVVAQSLDADGTLLSATGATATTSRGAFPASDAARSAQAVRAARLAPVLVAEAEGTDPAAAVAESPSATPTWYDPHLLSAPGEDVAVPAYSVVVRSGTDRHLALVSSSGALLQSVALTQEALNRVVCDAKRKRINTSSASLSAFRCGTTFAATRAEGRASSSVADVNAVYTYLGGTQGFYASNTGLGDLTAAIGSTYNDGRGKALRATVRICDTNQCPYTNAFWDGEQMVFGEGVTTDDVTGHELTHGVTQKTNGLVYQNESGAINESMSDVFGELYDLTNGSADDTAANRWAIGEGSSLGVIRSMSDPTRYGDPDSTSSPSYYRGSNQSTLVHVNSGVGNKAAFLITDGGTLNGRTVSGIGIARAAQLYWTVQTMLPASATYADLGRTLQSACAANVRNGVAGTTSANCSQVTQAAVATGMISG